jgi:hypothetical protein
MKTKIHRISLFVLFFVLCFSACQDEVTEIGNPSEQETIAANSNLSTLMMSTSANYGAVDDFLDGASCFSVELPVTIMVGDVIIVIETIEGLDNLEDTLQNLGNGQDSLDFVFPITIIFNDYSELVIENEEQLLNYINQCDNEEYDIIECADFVYPISFSVFNSEFNLIETVAIQSDEELYIFLEDLEDDENALIVSLNYPLSVQYGNGETVEVNTNQELVEAIEAAESNCDIDETENCVQDDVLLSLLECPWDFTDGTDAYDNYQLVFHQNGDLQITEGDTTVAIGGAWNMSLSNDGLVEVVISDLTAFSDDLEGSWIVIQCDVEGQLTLMRDQISLELNQDCYDASEVFNCFGDFELVECAGPNNIPVYNLSAGTIGLIDCVGSFAPSFHSTLLDAENNTNAIENTEAYETLEAQVYLRIEAQNGEFAVFNVFLNTEECNLFECFQSFDAVIELCDEGNDGIETFDLTLAFSNCTPSADVVSYHETLMDADSNVNVIANPQEFNNTSNPQTIYVRVEIDNQFEAFPIQLLLQDCNQAGCSEAQIDAFLVECIWNPVSYNGSDNLSDYNFDFDANGQNVLIYNAQITIAAFWSTSQSSDGLILDFGSVSGPNIQAITGLWLVVECNEDRLELNRGDDILVLERTCN